MYSSILLFFGDDKLVASDYRVWVHFLSLEEPKRKEHPELNASRLTHGIERWPGKGPRKKRHYGDLLWAIREMQVLRRRRRAGIPRAAHRAGGMNLFLAVGKPGVEITCRPTKKGSPAGFKLVTLQTRRI